MSRKILPNSDPVKGGRVREIVTPDGTTYRETLLPLAKNSFESVGDWFSGLGARIALSLTPFSIRGGFTISVSWVLFVLMWCFSGDTGNMIGAFWLLSLYVPFNFWRFR